MTDTAKDPERVFATPPLRRSRFCMAVPASSHPCPFRARPDSDLCEYHEQERSKKAGKRWWRWPRARRLSTDLSV
jgi:hypothetical protein